MKKTTTIRDLEQKVYESEGIRIVIRGDKDESVDSYPYERRTSKNTTVSEFIEKRIKPLTSGKSISVITGNGQEPRGNTLMGNVRKDYI